MSFDSSSQNPFQAPASGYSTNPTESPYRPSKGIATGVASILIGLLSLLAMCGAFAWVFMLIVENNGDTRPDNLGDTPSDSLSALFGIGLLGITSVGLSLIGSIVGLVGVVVPNQNKVIASIGLTINALLFLGMAGIVVLGTVGG